MDRVWKDFSPKIVQLARRTKYDFTLSLAKKHTASLKWRIKSVEWIEISKRQTNKKLTLLLCKIGYDIALMCTVS